ncbi:MAG TPA: trypsin-like peptidase domain-containing protein [Geobacteraceae bacterium]|nr:trypsin-like peptidase domain-containing protein [Geobacteraceae bacterium]
MRVLKVAALVFSLLFAVGVSSGAHSAPDSLAPLVKKLMPSVVNISTKQVVKARQQSPFSNPQMDQFFYRFFGNAPRQDQVRQSLGSGFIISSDGYILTNNHVVDKATDIKVALTDGRVFDAKLVGKSPDIDIALIKIDAQGLPSAVLGDSEATEVGDMAIAIGNPFGLSHTVTSGIISAKGRVIGIGPYDNLIQTDAAINPGNSGGPLFNSNGEVVGINTVIIASGQNLGFAVPITMVKEVLPSIKAKGRPDMGWLGVEAQPLTPDLAAALGLPEPIGALVTRVTPGGPAEKAGLKRGDVIVELDGKKILVPAELPRMVAFGHLGKTVRLTVIRQSQTIEIKAVIELRPEKQG